MAEPLAAAARWTVWKFSLGLSERQIVLMPRGAEVLHVAVQYDVPCLWARVDNAAPRVERRVFVVGTGHAAPPPTCKHVGSVLLHDGHLVFHVFMPPEG